MELVSYNNNSICFYYVGQKAIHYDNISLQYTVIFHSCKNDHLLMKNCDIFLIFAQNIDQSFCLFVCFSALHLRSCWEGQSS